MQNFVVLTDTPARLANFLTSRGIIEQQTDPLTGEQHYVGVRPGVEFAKVPNPIQTGVDGDGNPVVDTRHVYLVKFAHESEGEKADVFRDWIVANSSVVTAPANYTINGESAGNARKVNGQNVWLVHDRPERFGGWQ